MLAREGHENELPLHVIPAREQGHGGEHDEDVFPVEVVGDTVEAVGEHHGEDHPGMHISAGTKLVWQVYLIRRNFGTKYKVKVKEILLLRVEFLSS